jgi:pimeloyl-ACP methyl ester carboxylesterase
MTLREFTSSDGVRLAYKDLGDGPRTPIVFCHGLAASGEQFVADAPFFASRGHRVLVPDLRGHGRSDAPAALTDASLGIARLASDLLEMLDHAGVDRVHWVGNSLGGIVALEMLKARRFATLTTFGTTYAINLPRVGGHRLVAASHKLLGGDTLAALTARVTSRNPRARVLIEKILRELRPDVVTVLTGVLTSYDLIAAGAAADIPVLMLRGGEDRAVNAGLGDTLKAMRGKPNFRLVELRYGGHVANLDAADPFRAALIAFWTSVQS